jgi:uncharacterized protein YyaL (SSP411 family)
VQDELFWDEQDGGWFSTTGRDPSVLLRLKEDYDGAEPSASSVAVLNAIAIAHLTGDGAARAKAERTLARYGPRIGRAARAIPMMLTGLSAWHAGGSQIVIAGPRDRDETAAMMARVARVYQPFTLVVPLEPDSGDRRRRIAALVPGVAGMQAIGGRTTAYVCREFACQAPVTSADDLDVQLRDDRPAGDPQLTLDEKRR